MDWDDHVAELQLWLSEEQACHGDSFPILSISADSEAASAGESPRLPSPPPLEGHRSGSGAQTRRLFVRCRSGEAFGELVTPLCLTCSDTAITTSLAGSGASSSEFAAIADSLKDAGLASKPTGAEPTPLRAVIRKIIEALQVSAALIPHS